MSEKLKEFVEIPQEFIKDGQQVRNTRRAFSKQSRLPYRTVPHALHQALAKGYAQIDLHMSATQQCSVEFAQICKAVAVGFAVMGFIGYFVKLIHIPM